MLCLNSSTIHPHQYTTRLAFQGAEKVMVVVFGIGDGEMKFFEPFRLPVIAQLLDLINAHDQLLNHR